MSSYPSSMTINATAAVAAAAIVHLYKIGCGSRSSCHAMRSAAAGNSGRIYEGSFEPDTLKKQKTKTVQARQNRGHENPLLVRGASRHIRHAVNKNTPVHGISPTSNSGTKYHIAPGRRCSDVKNRSRCSWMKKKRANSGFLSETAMNQGADNARNTASPAARWRRFQTAKSRVANE